MPINNYYLLKPLLKFESDDEFYFLAGFGADLSFK